MSYHIIYNISSNVKCVFVYRKAISVLFSFLFVPVIFIPYLLIHLKIKSKIKITKSGILLTDVTKEIYIPAAKLTEINIKKVRVHYKDGNQYVEILGLCVNGSPRIKFKTNKGIIRYITWIIEIILQYISSTDVAEMAVMFTQNKKLSGCDVTIPTTFDYKLLINKFKEYFPDNLSKGSEKRKNSK